MIADDHPIFREGVKKFLGSEIDFSVTVEAENSAEAIEKIMNEDFDILLLDIGLPGRSGIDILPEVKRLKPNLPVLIYSMHPEERYAIRALKAGASGYLSKEEDADKLIEALRTIHSGRKYITPSLAEKLAFEIAEPTHSVLHETLSNREFEVMQKIALGKSIKEIADALSLSVNTVNTYRARILEKMQMKNNMDIARYAIKSNLID